MRSVTPRARRTFLAVSGSLVALGATALLVIGAAAPIRNARAAGSRLCGMPGMDLTAMRALAAAYWSTHAPTGVSSTQAPAAVFTAQNYVFDLDGNLATQQDTARIMVGQTVQWVWVNGIHTVTNGVDGLDPNSGTLFNHALDSGAADLSFSYTFTTAGTYPFHCAYHDYLGMKGVVIVGSPTPARRTSWGEIKARFRN